MALPSPLPSDSPTCPVCHSPLVLGGAGPANFWSCPQGHGVVCTMTAAYGRVQDDEIAAIWQAAKQAPPSDRGCPFCGEPMVAATVTVDADEQPGAAGPTSSATVDVCREDEAFWLEAGTLGELPQDLPNPQPTADEERNLRLVRQQFDSGLDAALEQERSADVWDRMADRIALRHPAFAGVLTDAVFRDEADALRDDLAAADGADPEDAPPA